MMNTEAEAASANDGDPERPRGMARIAQMEAQIDERDEIIRLLNDALSQALGELTELGEAA